MPQTSMTPAPVKRKVVDFVSPKTGKTHSFDWDKPDPPTADDYSALRKHVEEKEAAEQPTANEQNISAATTPAPPPVTEPEPEKSTFQKGMEYWSKDLGRQFGRNVSNVYGAAKRIKDIPMGIISQSPLYQQNQALQELSKPEAERTANTAAAKKVFDETLNIKHPYKLARDVASVVDPTGVVPDYMDLGQGTVEDIKNKNYGGAAVNVGLGAAPVAIPGIMKLGNLRRAKVATAGIDPAALPGKKPIGVVPDVIPPGEPGSFVELPKKVTKPGWDFDSHSSGVGDVTIPDTPEMHGPPRSLGITERKSSQFSLKPEGDRTVPVVMNEAGGIDFTRTKNIGTIEDRPKKIVYITSEVDQAIRSKKVANNLLEGSDHLASDPLLSTVPNRLRPETPNVAAIREASGGEASVGKGGARTVTGQPKGKLEFVNEADYLKQKAEIDALEKTAATERAARAKSAEQLDKQNQRRKEARETGVDVDSIVEEKLKTVSPEMKTNPTFMNAVKAIPDRIRNSNLYKAWYKPAGVSTLTKLERLGEKGKELSKVLYDERTETNRYAGEHTSRTRDAFRALSEAEQTEVTRIMDEQIPLSQASSPKVVEAYHALRASTNELGDAAVAKGVKMKNSKGETVPFEKWEGEYWPHIYDEELFKDPVKLRAKLLEAGNSPVTVDAMMKRVTEKGERFSPAQHSRDFNLPGYRQDLSALEKHQFEMARAITRAERFGPLDVADPNSRISKLISETDNPTEAAKLVNEYLSRIEDTDVDTQAKFKNYENAVKIQVATKMSQFAITNIGDLAALHARFGTWKTLKAMGKVITDPHGSVDISTRTGAQNVVRKEIVESMGKDNLLSKAYFSNTTEKAIRSVGSIAGRAEVQSLFDKAKKDPRYVPALARYVDGDVNVVLKQDKLTPKQIDFGGGRGVELSSGIPDRLTLSKAFFADNPTMRLPFLFKRFAFVNTKNIIDAVAAQPTLAKKAAKATSILAAYNIIGEGVGDVKSAIKGLVSGDIEKEFYKRDDYINSEEMPIIGKAIGGPVLDRIMANYLQSALFGLVGDTAETAVHRSGQIMGALGGPVGGDIDELGRATYNAVNPAKGKRRTEGFEKFAVRRVPFIGAGLAERFYPSDKKGSKLSMSAMGDNMKSIK